MDLNFFDERIIRLNRRWFSCSSWRIKVDTTRRFHRHNFLSHCWDVPALLDETHRLRIKAKWEEDGKAVSELCKHWKAKKNCCWFKILRTKYPPHLQEKFRFKCLQLLLLNLLFKQSLVVPETRRADEFFWNVYTTFSLNNWIYTVSIIIIRQRLRPSKWRVNEMMCRLFNSTPEKNISTLFNLWDDVKSNEKRATMPETARKPNNIWDLVTYSYINKSIYTNDTFFQVLDEPCGVLVWYLGRSCRPALNIDLKW